MTTRRSPSPAPQKDFSVAVVGGGLVGALAAVYFARRGFAVTVIERRQDIRKDSAASGRSINLALSARGIAGLAGAGIDAALAHALIPMRARLVHLANGTLSSQPYGVRGEAINSVDRKIVNQKLLDAAENLPNVTLLFEHTVDSCDPDSGILVVKNTRAGDAKQTIHADLIIGADGAHSRIRSDLINRTRVDFSQTYIDHAYVELTMPPSSSGDFAMEPSHLHIWPRNTFMMIALPNLDKSFTVTLFMPWSKFDAIKTESDLLAFFNATFPDAVPLIGKDFLVQEYFKNYKGALMTVKCNPYHYKDRLVIVGDAAHAMVPFYGQGMNCGFEDMLVLDELFTAVIGPPSTTRVRPTSTQIASILSQYSAKRNPDAEAICDLALGNYIEMRSSVAKTSYMIRKRIEEWLHKIMPGTIIPLYTMVSFSRIPYSVALARSKRQMWWFDFAARVGLGLCLVGGLGFMGAHRRMVFRTLCACWKSK